MGRVFARGLLFAISLLAGTASAAEAVLSAFAGSTLKGTYTTEFGAFTYATGVNGSENDLHRLEGQLVSRIFLKPQGKSNLELFRSYEAELERNGFEILLAASPADGNVMRLVQTLYKAPNNDMGARVYQGAGNQQVFGNDLDRIRLFSDHYLVASRQAEGKQIVVAVVLSRERNLYMIDEATAAAMETGTVTLNADALERALTESGRIAVYDLYFATGSAVIEPRSKAALDVIADYLSRTDGRYYIVGHTDDTGSLTNNLRLSEARAQAVREALVRDYGIAADRLEARGVGPLSPVSTNRGEQGRALNRRVEIVERIGKP